MRVLVEPKANGVLRLHLGVPLMWRSTSGVLLFHRAPPFGDWYDVVYSEPGRYPRAFLVVVAVR
jgi:hypothetical protein